MKKVIEKLKAGDILVNAGYYTTYGKPINKAFFKSEPLKSISIKYLLPLFEKGLIRQNVEKGTIELTA